MLLPILTLRLFKRTHKPRARRFQLKSPIPRGLRLGRVEETFQSRDRGIPTSKPRVEERETIIAAIRAALEKHARARDLLRVKQTKEGENRGDGLHARNEIADGDAVHSLRDFHPELLLEMLDAVLDVPERKRGVEVGEGAAAQIADELRAEQVETQRVCEPLVVLELSGERFAGALERTVRGEAGDAGVEDVHEGKDLGSELRNDLAEIAPVLRG